MATLEAGKLLVVEILGIRGALNSLMHFLFRKGVIWLFLAAGTGFIAVASIVGFLVVLCSQTFSIHIVAVHLFEPDPYFFLSNSL
jgi:hypothetical protein